MSMQLNSYNFNLSTRFREFNDDMPVLWHQCLLTLLQRYKQDLTVDQKKDVLRLIAIHHHHDISPEIQVCRMLKWNLK